MTGCRKPEITSKLEPFIITGTPSAIYEMVRPKIQRIIPTQTEIVRIDNDTGMILRFSIKSPTDGSVRLVEVNIQKIDSRDSRILISSEQFSFFPKENHDSIDSGVELMISKEFTPGS